MPEIENRWFAVVNRHAGNGKTSQVWRRAKKMLDNAGVLHEDRYTDCKLHATEIAYRAASEGERNFIVAGGDGTIHEVLDGIMKFVEQEDVIERQNGVSEKPSLEDFFLAAVPVGSGNDWIKIHGVDFDLGETVRLIKERSFIGQDVVKVSVLDRNDENIQLSASYMINIAGVGFDARVCERVNEKKDRGRHGKLIYVGALLYHLFHYRSSRMRIVCDGATVWDGDCFSMAIGTGKYSGGGMRQTPEAVFDDGLTDYTIIPSYPVWRILWEAPKLFTGKLLSVKEIFHGRARSISVFPSSPDGDLVEVDGEVIGSSPIRLTLHPEKINVLHKK